MTDGTLTQREKNAINRSLRKLKAKIVDSMFCAIAANWRTQHRTVRMSIDGGSSKSWILCGTGLTHIEIALTHEFLARGTDA